MESVTSNKTQKSKQNLNLHVAECVREFELPRQFPSTVTELRLSKSGTEKNTVMQTKNVQNIIAALPLGKMKFIPNKEVAPSENLQKLKLKSISGKDLGEFKLLMPGTEETVPRKIITVSKVNTNSDKCTTICTIKSQSVGESKKPRIKTITKMYNSSVLEEHLSNEKNSVKLKEHLTNCALPGHQHDNTSNISSTDCSELSNGKMIIHKGDNNLVKRLIIENTNSVTDKYQSQVITLKKFPNSQKFVTHDDNQVFKSMSETFNLQLKPFKTTSFGSQITNKIIEKVIVKNLSNDSTIRKRESTVLETTNLYERKKPCIDFSIENSSISEDSQDGSFLHNEQTKNFKSLIKQMPNILPSKDLMVIFPNDAAEELTIMSNSSDVNNEHMMQKYENISNSTNNEGFENQFYKSALCNIEQIDFKTNQGKNLVNISPTKTNNIGVESKCLSDDRFSILEKAVLSVTDVNLREKALKALKDCGIKIKKKVPIRRPFPTKVINESTTQTEVFSMLKYGEFILANEQSENLVKIKKTRPLMKHSINTFLKSKSTNKRHSEQHLNKYKSDLDKTLEKVFLNNKGVLDVKGALIKNKVIHAKITLKQLESDFNSAKNYDSDGLLGIHRSVMNNNMKEVQRQIIILKSLKKSVDVYSQDEKTSLELAVEFEVDPQIVKILLDSGAKPVSTKPIHDSALILAAKISSSILRLLCNYINPEQKSLLNNKNSEGLAAIHYCAQYGNFEGISKLVELGADVNLQDERSGRTALFYAVETKNSDVSQEVYNEIAHKLLEYGAISNIPIFSKHSVLALIDDVKSHALKIALNRAVK